VPAARGLAGRADQRREDPSGELGLDPVDRAERAPAVAGEDVQTETGGRRDADVLELAVGDLDPPLAQRLVAGDEEDPGLARLAVEVVEQPPDPVRLGIARRARPTRALQRLPSSPRPVITMVPSK
jgi:hypothetical protein